MTTARNVTVTPRCPICKAKAGEDCTNTITPGDPLPGRRFHFARFEDTSWRDAS